MLPDTSSSTGVRREGRWVAVATWLAILAPLPYSLSRLLWAAGIPVGIDRELLREFDVPGYGSVYILALAAMADATALLTHTFVRRRARRVPARIPLLGGKAVRPGLVIAVLAVPTAILAWRAALHLTLLVNGFRIPDHITGVPPWALWTQAALVWIWWTSLGAALIAYRRAMRHAPASAPDHPLTPEAPRQ